MNTGNTNQRERGFSMIELLIAVVVLAIVLGMVLQILATVQQDYLEQRQLMELQNTAVTAVDSIVRLVRMAGSNPNGIALTPINPDPDGNSTMDSIRVQADWNPPDGALDDPFEDVRFTTSGNVLMTQTPADANPVPFLEGISSVTFTYVDANGATIANPVASAGNIVLVRLTVQTEAVGTNSITLTSSAAVRSRLQ